MRHRGGDGSQDATYALHTAVADNDDVGVESLRFLYQDIGRFSGGFNDGNLVDDLAK